jgi:predicted RNA-binding Zn-ribbon protein involved in translation (DUF1610 family)
MNQVALLEVILTDSLRLAKLVCPSCEDEVWLDVPRVLSITYVCGKCGASVEHSFLTGSVRVKSVPPHDTTD